MSYKRRQYKRKRNVRRKKYQRGRLYRAPKTAIVHHYKRSQVIKATPAGQNLTNYVFTLDSSPGYTDFTNLYEMYSIRGIKVRIIPTVNAAFLDTGELYSNAVTSSTAGSGWIHTVLDRDGQPPANLNEMAQEADYKVSRASGIHKRYWVPNILGMAYETVSTTGYTPKYKQWISTNDPNVPHYGLTIYWDIDITANPDLARFKIVVTYYIACKGTR